MRLSICVTAFGACSTTKLQPKIPRVISLRDDFQTYVASINAGDPNPERGLTSRHEKVFSDFVYREVGSDQQKLNARYDRLRKFVRGDAEAATRILRTFTQLESEAPKHISTFKKMFPEGDYAYQVYLLPSFLWFSGRAGFVDQNTIIVAFGADQISANNENAPVLFAHEMFHALHFKTLKFDKERHMKAESDPWASLWIEGFASYISAIATGTDPTLEGIFGRSGHQCAQKKDTLLKAFLADANAHPVFSDLLLDKWFGAGDDQKGVPSMAAYCLGVLAMKELIRTHSIAELLVWDPVEHRADIRKTLEKL